MNITDITSNSKSRERCEVQLDRMINHPSVAELVIAEADCFNCACQEIAQDGYGDQIVFTDHNAFRFDNKETAKEFAKTCRELERVGEAELDEYVLFVEEELFALDTARARLFGTVFHHRIQEDFCNNE